MMQFPLISCTQKIVIYETKARLYVVGSNNTETRFRVLKIDRTEPKELHITDDKVEYSCGQIRNLLQMIDVGNRSKITQRGNTGLTRTVSAFGIVGFVRFLEGYYIVLITKRRRVALIGHHTIYKIEDTNMVYIPNDTVRYFHPDELRYMKMFQNVDLSSNFYFSYSYDLTHTLQYNLAPCQDLQHGLSSDLSEEELKFWQTDKKDLNVHKPPHFDADVEDANNAVKNFLEDTLPNNVIEEEKTEKKEGTPLKGLQHESWDQELAVFPEFVYGVKTKPTMKYVWNEHMLKDALEDLHSDWVLPVIHGFIGQSNICVHGRPIYLTLLARRSNKFAGTRFLKRGANTMGNVANEIETEQILQDFSLTSLKKAKFTSFVQLRGSIPLHWSQDIQKMVPKPSITLDQSDPYGYIAGQHFNWVLRRYGAPIIILNLVKSREKKRHESILKEEFVNVIQYLNQFLPTEHSIKYIGFDMARYSKSTKNDVLLRLSEIAEYCVKKTGFFQSFPGLYCNKLRPHAWCRGMQSPESSAGRAQHGVVRTNCVDCLDRTNTAQFAIGKCALAFQLHSMGILNTPSLEFDTDCVRMLEDLYEDHGDTLALQYGGSQLVHRIKGYRKVAPWTSSSRDIMQTLSRYYSNAFSDSDKQHAMNLFLGIYEPQEGQPNLWELTTDFYLHNPMPIVNAPVLSRRAYSQWWDAPVVLSLPEPYEEESKGEKWKVVIKTHAGDERIDGFWEYYKPYELTCLDELYSMSMANSIRDFMPKAAASHSPFALRVQPKRRQEEHGISTVTAGKDTAINRQRNLTTEANPNVSGKDSTASTASTGSEGSTSSSDGSDIEGDIEILDDNDIPKEDSGLSLISLKDLFPTMAQTYGVEIKEPDKCNTSVYKRYVAIGENASQPFDSQTRGPSKTTELIQTSIFPLDSTYNVEPPKVSTQSKDIYQTFVKRGEKGPGSPSRKDLIIYQKYMSTKYL